MATYSGRTEQPWKHPPAAGRECGTAQSHEIKKKKSGGTLKHPPTVAALANTLLQTGLKADIPNHTDSSFFKFHLDIVKLGTKQDLVPHSKISASSRAFHAVPGGAL